MEQQKYAVQVSLQEAQCAALAALIQGEAPPVDKLGALATQALSEMANGGMLIDAATMKNIVAMIGEVNDALDLIPVIEKATSHDAGRVVVSWAIDPSWIEPLKGIAVSQGITVQQLCQNCMDYAFAQGWLYSISPEPKVFRFTPEEEKEMEEIFGKKDLTGADVMEWIREQATLPIGKE
jgi:hypothetical protein